MSWTQNLINVPQSCKTRGTCFFLTAGQLDVSGSERHFSYQFYHKFQLCSPQSERSSGTDWGVRISLENRLPKVNKENDENWSYLWIIVRYTRERLKPRVQYERPCLNCLFSPTIIPRFTGWGHSCENHDSKGTKNRRVASVSSDVQPSAWGKNASDAERRHAGGDVTNENARTFCNLRRRACNQRKSKFSTAAPDVRQITITSRPRTFVVAAPLGNVNVPPQRIEGIEPSYIFSCTAVIAS